MKFPTDDRGFPTGDGCLLDKQVAVRYAAGVQWTMVTRRFHQEDAFRKGFLISKDQWTLLRKLDLESGRTVFDPATLVSEMNEFGLVLSSRVLLLRN